MAGVGKSFGRVRALDGVDLDVPAGRRVALLGPNGSGKSTLIRAIMGLIAHEGSVTLDGRSLASARTELGRRMAYAPQVAPQVAAPVRELVRAIASLRGMSVSAVAECAAEMDLDLEAIGPRPFRDLSGGMKQKLLVAMALAGDAGLLILDEPTASLDPRARERFFRLFTQRADGRTLVLCSHRFDELARLVDHVVLLREGRVSWEGSATAFLDARAASVIEINAPGAEAELAAAGFARGLSSWWSCTASRTDASELVRRLTPVLGDRLIDIAVRSVETVEASKPGEARP